MTTNYKNKGERAEDAVRGRGVEIFRDLEEGGRVSFTIYSNGQCVAGGLMAADPLLLQYGGLAWYMNTIECDWRK